jgi:hypothetical protein
MEDDYVYSSVWAGGRILLPVRSMLSRFPYIRAEDSTQMRDIHLYIQLKRMQSRHKMEKNDIPPRSYIIS